MDVITKNIARGFIKTIGPEKIGKMAGELINVVIAEKSKVELLPGEIDVVGIIYELNGIANFAQVAIRDNEAGETEISRYIYIKTINELLQSLLENI